LERLLVALLWEVYSTVTYFNPLKLYIIFGCNCMSKVIRVRYENGVLKPLEPLELEEGEEVLVTVKRDIRKILGKYRGILGRSSIRELLEIEEEAHIQ